MKYIYKHGNKFWYQRAVPLKLVELVGVRSIKVSLNTNKIQTAITRSKLQAIEHKKMFNKLAEKPKNSFLEILKNNKIKLKNYEINFLDDYEDYISDFIFSNESFSKINVSSIKKYFSDRNILICKEITKYYEEYFRFKVNELDQKNITLKGEITLVLSEKKIENKTSNNLSESDKIKIGKLIKKLSIKEIVDLIKDGKNIPKKEIYNYCLKIKNEK